MKVRFGVLKAEASCIKVRPLAGQQLLALLRCVGCRQRATKERGAAGLDLRMSMKCWSKSKLKYIKSENESYANES